ncbi:TIM21-domain-containing protein, partial [Parasitella parasitica]
RPFSTPARYVPSNKKSNSLATAKPWSELTTPEKGVILTGVALTSAIVYYIGSELFGSQSSTSIFSDAVDRIRGHEELVQMLGEPIKAHGEP